MTLLLKNTIWLLLGTTMFAATTWKVFKSEEGKFSIMTPGEFQQNVQTMETDIGKIDYFSFVHSQPKADGEKTTFAVSYCDYPDNSIHSDSTSFLVEFFEASIAQSIPQDGHLIYSETEAIGEFPGRIWRVDYSEGKRVKAKAFLIKNRFYLLQVFTYKGDDDRHSSDKFLNSFRLAE